MFTYERFLQSFLIFCLKIHGEKQQVFHDLLPVIFKASKPTSISTTIEVNGNKKKKGKGWMQNKMQPK